MPAAVASGHPLVSDAAETLLRAGGNAFDAAIAAGFAASLAEPMFTSLGGGGFLLARDCEGRETLFDFFADTPGRGRDPAGLDPHFVPMTVHFPASDQVFNIGLGSVAVPGTLAGFLHVHERLGRLPLEAVLAPAVALAREGVVLNAHQAYVIGLLEPINTLTEAGCAVYAPQGRVPREGERILNPDLAAFLDTLPEDRGRSLFGGSIASAIERDMDAGGGLLTARDLADYAVVERAPLSFAYRGRRVLTNPAPSFGGSLIALSLGILEQIEAEPAWGSGAHLIALSAVMQEVDALRDRVAGESLDALLAAAAPAARRATGGTTHISVCDDEGNAASLSLSNGEGSGYVAPGAGIMLNNMLGEDDLHPHGFHASAPGERVASMMSPTMAVDGSDVVLILGSGGSKRIRSAIVQVLTGVLDAGWSIERAVMAPRIHWDGAVAQVEPGFEADALRALEAVRPINLWPERNLYFGGVHAVEPRGAAAGDPRREGDGRVIDVSADAALQPRA
jgi:gamma-glutamyltranspeptidase/glutathione hydrolase